jgi:hypothetical protein
MLQLVSPGGFEEGDPRSKLGISLTPWQGRAFNLDEAYEFWGHLDLTGKSRGEKESAPSVHASTVNTLIASGKTRRATRGCANFGESRGKTVSISIVGNGHPSKFIAMDRGLVGSHTAATKERFLIALDHAAARHAALPPDTELPEGVQPWIWLPLTPQQAAVFLWETLYDDPGAAEDLRLEPDFTEYGEEPLLLFTGPPGGYKISFPDGNETRLRYVVTAEGLRTEFRISSRCLLPDPTEHIRAGADRVAVHFAEAQFNCALRL